MTIHPCVRTAFAAAVICSLTLITFTFGRVTMARKASPSDAAVVGQGSSAPATRFAVIDTELLAAQGIRLEGNATTEADLKDFGSRLNVNIIDAARLRGVIFIGDESFDLTDDFIAAVKAKASSPGQAVTPTKNVPDSKVAFINTDAFADPEAGIKSLTKAFAALEREFRPRREELGRLREQAAAATGEKKVKLESEVAKKTAATQAELRDRLKEMTGPVYQDIGKALSQFCKRHGISLIFDASKFNVAAKLPPFGLMIPLNTPDVSAAFISEYNRGVLKP